MDCYVVDCRDGVGVDVQVSMLEKTQHDGKLATRTSTMIHIRDAREERSMMKELSCVGSTVNKHGMKTNCHSSGDDFGQMFTFGVTSATRHPTHEDQCYTSEPLRNTLSWLCIFMTSFQFKYLPSLS